MLTKEKADAVAEIMKSIVPSTWTVRVDKHNDTFKVVSYAAGMAIVCNPLNGMFYVTIDNGPGLAKNLSPRSYGDIGFDNSSEAYSKETIRRFRGAT